jgi:hypothetical protein
VVCTAHLWFIATCRAWCSDLGKAQYAISYICSYIGFLMFVLLQFIYFVCWWTSSQKIKKNKKTVILPSSLPRKYSPCSLPTCYSPVIPPTCYSSSLLRRVSLSSAFDENMWSPLFRSGGPFYSFVTFIIRVVTDTLSIIDVSGKIGRRGKRVTTEICGTLNSRFLRETLVQSAVF